MLISENHWNHEISMLASVGQSNSGLQDKSRNRQMRWISVRQFTKTEPFGIYVLIFDWTLSKVNESIFCLKMKSLAIGSMPLLHMCISRHLQQEHLSLLPPKAASSLQGHRKCHLLQSIEHWLTTARITARRDFPLKYLQLCRELHDYPVISDKPPPSGAPV